MPWSRPESSRWGYRPLGRRRSTPDRWRSWWACKAEACRPVPADRRRGRHRRRREGRTCCRQGRSSHRRRPGVVPRGRALRPLRRRRRAPRPDRHLGLYSTARPWRSWWPCRVPDRTGCCCYRCGLLRTPHRRYRAERRASHNSFHSWPSCHFHRRRCCGNRLAPCCIRGRWRRPRPTPCPRDSRWERRHS